MTPSVFPRLLLRAAPAFAALVVLASGSAPPIAQASGDGGARLLRTADGAPWRVRAVRLGRQAPTYNLTVAETSTYFVGAEPVLAHNTSPCGDAQYARRLERLWARAEQNQGFATCATCTRKTLRNLAGPSGGPMERRVTVPMSHLDQVLRTRSRPLVAEVRLRRGDEAAHHVLAVVTDEHHRAYFLDGATGGRGSWDDVARAHPYYFRGVTHVDLVPWQRRVRR